MNALRQKIRPKHQLLILKCYPKLPKLQNNTSNNTAPEELKPNGSELSYLLYYASARRSKLTKVGTFLEKKTAADVYKGRVPAVLITLMIVEAFVGSAEVCGGKEGFGLFAPFVLRILREVLDKPGSVEVVEEAGKVWQGFCRHQDHASLAGDAEYRALFEGVVRVWAEFARKTHGKKSMSASEEIRLRKAGLEAMKAVARSEALNSESASRQMETLLGVVLQNLWADDASYLVVLEAREKEAGKERDANAARGRPSMATVRTARTNEETDPRAAEGTTADADKIAEEEAGQLALQCLRVIYHVDNRGQIRLATSCLLAFIAQQGRGSRQSDKGVATPHGSSWATALFKLVCNWTPVQDRFVVLFTAVETLIRTPIVEEELEKQLVFSHVIGQVLASNINLIGLSIMDILLGLVQHVLLILQVGTTHPTLNGGEITSSDESLKHSGEKRRVVMEVVKTASPARLQLLAQLRECIANLATHVYYTDQISDMASAILLRLKPSPGSAHNPAVTAAAIEDPTSAVAEVASNASLRERPNTDGFFSFDTAREVALDAVKDIMTVAKTSQLDGSSSSRNPVPISVWEGTQWLLRDSSDSVRKTYVDALCTWLDLETVKSDCQLEDKTTTPKSRKENGNGDMARRAVSNASARNRASKRGRSTFLQLLHLAIYEEALERADAPDADSEFMTLHLLLASLSERLGINAVRTGLPMVFRLQEDIQLVSSAQAKIRLGSLVHGYLQNVTAIFGIESSVAGSELEAEISRRKHHGIWLEGIATPPLPITAIPAARRSAGLSATAASNESLKPFDHRQQFVQAVTEAYMSSVASPPSSPPASPSRSFSLPMLSDPSYLNPVNIVSSRKNDIPSGVTDDLSAPWSKDILLSTLASSAPKSLSLSGSRTGGFAGQTQHGSRTELFRGGPNDHRHLLAAANTFPMTSAAGSKEGSPSRNGSAGAVSGAQSLRNSVRRGGAGALSQRKPHRLASRSPNAGVPGTAAGGRRASASTQGNNGRAASTRTNSIAGNGVSRLDELKRALATGSAPAANVAALGRLGSEDYSDDDEEVGDGDYESSYGEDEYGTPNDATSAPSTGSGSVPGAATNLGQSTTTTGDKMLPQLPRFSSDKGYSTAENEELPSWSAAAMAELNAQGGGIHILRDDNSNENNTLAAPPTIQEQPPTPLAGPPELTSSGSNGYGLLGQGEHKRPTTATTTGSRRMASKGGLMTYGNSGPSNAGSIMGKKDLNDLLDSVGIDEDVSARRKSGYDAPPY